MKINKKTLLYCTGAIVAYISAPLKILAQPDLGISYYGPPIDLQGTEESFWEKVIPVVLSPLFILIISTVTVAIGVIIYFRKKYKNVEKNNKTGKAKNLDHS